MGRREIRDLRGFPGHRLFRRRESGVFPHCLGCLHHPSGAGEKICPEDFLPDFFAHTPGASRPDAADNDPLRIGKSVPLPEQRKGPGKRHPFLRLRAADHHRCGAGPAARLQLFRESAAAPGIFGHKDPASGLPEHCLVQFCRERSLHGGNMGRRNAGFPAGLECLRSGQDPRKQALLRERRKGGKLFASRCQKDPAGEGRCDGRCLRGIRYAEQKVPVCKLCPGIRGILRPQDPDQLRPGLRAGTPDLPAHLRRVGMCRVQHQAESAGFQQRFHFLRILSALQDADRPEFRQHLRPVSRRHGKLRRQVMPVAEVCQKPSLCRSSEYQQLFQINSSVHCFPHGVSASPALPRSPPGSLPPAYR